MTPVQNNAHLPAGERGSASPAGPVSGPVGERARVVPVPGTGATLIRGAASGDRNGLSSIPDRGTASGDRSGLSPIQNRGTASGDRSGLSPIQNRGTASGDRSGLSPSQNRGTASPDRLRSAAGEFLTARGVPAELWESSGAGRSPESQRFLDRLAGEVALREAADRERRWPADRRVRVIGEGEILDALTEALTAWGATIESVAEPAVAAITHPTLVIAFHEGPGPRPDWSAADTLPAIGAAWLRGYREGSLSFIDPIAVVAGDPGAEQVRRRRLAASPDPRALRAWQQEGFCPVPVLPGTRALILARLLHIALAWAQDRTELPELRRRLWKHNESTAVTTEHVVLSFDAPPEMP